MSTSYIHHTKSNKSNLKRTLSLPKKKKKKVNTQRTSLYFSITLSLPKKQKSTSFLDPDQGRDKTGRGVIQKIFTGNDFSAHLRGYARLPTVVFRARRLHLSGGVLVDIVLTTRLTGEFSCN
ncbi:hypothetical protein CDAR_436321 [Caerostris darwini]|uniref:Uncharacterized protein n=1 Tax=Caerostris darwini TaxID=1538125 RepID=A0AAV4R8X9_9ARAC|nr:hypothetical protein CDAR_436321 [Caerostris darwini]